MMGEAAATPLSAATLSSCSSASKSSSPEEIQRLPNFPALGDNKKKFSKQLSLLETTRERAWEKRKRQISLKVNTRNQSNDGQRQGVLTDEDLNELKGCIELGFGFNEEKGHRLCHTLPALDLYFAVNRQLSSAGSTPITTPNSSITRRSLPVSPEEESPSADTQSPNGDSDAWKICNPGDNPAEVKTKLRHWAQAVACSVMQSY